MANSPPTKAAEVKKVPGAPTNAAELKEVTDTPPKKPGRKKLLFIVAGVLVLGIGGSGAWVMLKGKDAQDGEAHAKPVKAARHEGPPVFLPLDAFIVNLQPHGSEHFLQTDMTLRVAGLDVADQIKSHMPEVRNRVLMLLSTRTSEELITAEGKKKLAEAIRTEIMAVIDPESVKPQETPKLTKQPADSAAPAADSEEAPPVKEAQAEDAEPAANTEDTPPEESRIRSVLFTSFIIQ